MPRQKSNINMAEPLKYWRTKRGYSQSRLAQLADTSALTISQLESGKRKGRGKTLGKILDGLKLTREEFFAMRERSPAGAELDTFEATASVQVGGAESTIGTATKEPGSVRLSNLDLELLNRMLNLDFDGKLETLRFLQNLK